MKMEGSGESNESRRSNENEAVKIQSPTRVDLAGGTLDMWPLYNFVHGSHTINLAISIYTHVEIEKRPSEIEWVSEDFQETFRFKNLEACLSDVNPKTTLLRAVLEYARPSHGLKIKTKSESPIGGGLGGSSSLLISMLKGLAMLRKQTWQTRELVQVAHNIESTVLNTPTGTQDYYPAISGGLNILTYSPSGIEHEVLPVEGTPFATHAVLVYTGQPHHSGLNNFEVLKSAVGKDARVMSALKEIKDISKRMVQVVHDQDWAQIPALMQEETAARIRLSPGFTSPEIEKLREISRHNGALATKICGAGGGGCVLIWVPPQHQQKVRDECQKVGFRVLEISSVDPL